MLIDMMLVPVLCALFRYKGILLAAFDKGWPALLSL